MTYIKKNLKLLIIVFARSEKEAVAKTIDSLSRALNDYSINYKVVYIDDFSEDASVDFLRASPHYLNGFFDILEKEPLDLPGIKFCLEKVMRIYPSDQVLPIPGHFMFDSDSIKRVLSRISSGVVVIGYRTNLFRSRPIVKFIAAKLFLWTCKIFFSPYKIKDPHGLNSYPTMVVEQSFQLMTSHENHILPIALALKNGLMVVNVPVEVRREHKREGNRKNVPKITDVLDSINNLLLARKILKNKN